MPDKRPFQVFLTGCAVTIIALSTIGCGGGSGGGESLNSQYEKAMAVTNSTARVTELLRVAEKQQAAMDSAGMEKSISAAEAAADAIEDAKGKCTALNRVAEKWAEMGRPSEAKATLKKVRSSVDGIADAESKASAMTTLARIYGKHLDSKDIATVYLKNCNDDVISTIERAEGKIQAMLDVAFAYHEVGESAEGEALTTAALEQIVAFTEPRDRADSLAATAATLAKMGKSDEATATFEESTKAIGEIPESLSQAYAWLNLAERYHDAGQSGAAQSALQQAQDAADKVTDRSMQGPLLEKIQLTRGTLR